MSVEGIRWRPVGELSDELRKSEQLLLWIAERAAVGEYIGDGEWFLDDIVVSEGDIEYFAEVNPPQ